MVLWKLLYRSAVSDQQPDTICQAARHILFSSSGELLSYVR